MINNKADELFYDKKYNTALELYKSLNKFYEAGLCSLLLGDEKNAKMYWESCKHKSRAADWGLCVLDLINLRKTKKPCFFQTRAFLEIYLNLFLENNLIEWAQNFISCSDFLFQSNPESYKFIARVLFANSYFDLAITFCKKSIKVFYADPEAFLILSQCYYLIGDLGEALDCINKITYMVQDYYPANLFKQIILEDIEKKHKN